MEPEVNEVAEKLPTYTPGREAIDITPDKDGGVLKEIKRIGTGMSMPLSGDTVSVHYTGTLTDGTKFDSSRDRGEYFEFNLGKGSVIKAWDIGVATMKKGELSILYCKPEYAYGEAGSPPKIPANATLVFEVELFDWKGEDVSEAKDGGILKSILKEGEGFQNPRDGATCEIHIVGRVNGVEFDNRILSIIIGEATEVGVVDGVEQALKKMKKNEVARITILQSRYGFGASGNPASNIPPNAQLEYEVELKTFEKCKESWELESKEKLEQSEIYKNRGNDFFKVGKYKIASKYYKRIIDYLKTEESMKDEEGEKRRQLLVAGHLNIAMCHIKTSEHLEAVHACEEALKLEPKNEKGLFRRATANMSLQNFTEALRDLKSVVEIDPDNKAAKNQLAVVNEKLKQVYEKEKRTYAGMFTRFAEADAKKFPQVATVKENGDGVTVNDGDTEHSETKVLANGDENVGDNKESTEHSPIETPTQA